MANLHRHAILVRTMVAGRLPILTPIGVALLDTDEVQDALILEAERQAKGLLNPDPVLKALQADSVFYMIDGKTEYFISKYYYAWPNFTDREDRKRPVRKPRGE